MNYDQDRTDRRLEATAITRYIRYINSESKDTEKLEEKIRVAEEKIARYAEEGQVLRMLEWIEKRNQLEAQLDGAENAGTLEEGFVKYAKGFAQRKNISYRTFREAGVAAEVLKKAGLG